MSEHTRQEPLRLCKMSFDPSVHIAKILYRRLSVLVIAGVCGASPMAFAQSTDGLSRNELDLPVTTESPAVGMQVRIDKGAKSNESCAFDDSDLTTAINDVSFVTATDDPVPSQIATLLSEISAPAGEHPLAVICDIRDEANAALRRAGWIASVQVPEQELVDTLRLNVVTARISDIEITGDPGPYRERLETQLDALRQLSPLNEFEVERILMNINDIPGLDIQMSLAPGNGLVGDVRGNLAVTYQPYAAFLNARNYNGKRIGRETIYGRFEYYGLTGASDLSYVGAQTTFDFKEQFLVQAGHEFGLSGSPLRIGANVTYATSSPDLETLDLESEAFLVNFDVTYPILRTPNKIANMSMGFDYIDQRTDIGVVELSEDAIRALYLRGDVNGTKRRLNGSSAVDYSAFLELRHGINIFGATEFGPLQTAQTDGLSASRPFGDSTSFIARAGANASASLSRQFGARARVEGQWAGNPLLNYDEYSIGNLSIGRGYDPGANSGDRAIGAAFELNANVYAGAKSAVQFFGFYDVVQVENLDFGTIDPTRTLESIGAGARFSLGNGLQAEVTYAKPLDRALASDAEKPPERLLFSITTKFPALFR